MKAWLQRPAVRRVATVGSAFSLVAGLIGVLGNLERVPEYVCRVPGLHMLCGAVGVGNVAGTEEQKIWALAESASEPAPLRAYLSTYPKGVYADSARTRLAACRSTPREVWTPEQRSLPLYVPAGASGEPSLAAAHEAALQRGEADAAAACAAFTGEFRLQKSQAQVREWSCRDHDNGTACSFDGTAVCDVESRQVLSEETCR